MSSNRWATTILLKITVHVWLCFQIMTHSITASLIPSQVASCRGQRRLKSDECQSSKSPPIVCGDGRQRITSLGGKNRHRHDAGGDEIVFSVDKFPKQSAPQKKKCSQKKKEQRTRTNQSSKNDPQKKKINIKRNGNIPDIHWCVFSWLCFISLF